MKKLTLILFFSSGLILASCSTEPVFKASDGAAQKRTPAPTESIRFANHWSVTDITSTGATSNWDAAPNAT
jgi:hypothetical protein